MPHCNLCYVCQDVDAPIERTFVHLYPTLQPIAKEFAAWRRKPRSEWRTRSEWFSGSSHCLTELKGDGCYMGRG